MPNIARYARPLRLAVLPLLAIVGVATFLLMRPRLANEPAPVEAAVEPSTEAATVAAPAMAPANTAAEVAPDVLAQALAAWRDPFQEEAAELASMQGKIKLKEKEIEVLKLALEEKKLREQLRGGAGRDSVRTREASTLEVAPAGGRITVKALLCGDTRRAALLANGSTSAWVSEGDSFGGMQVLELDADTATLMNAAGRRVVISMQR